MVEPMPAPIEPSRTTPSVGAAISWAWGAFKRNAATFVGLVAAVAVVQVVQIVVTNRLSATLDDCVDATTPGQVNACEAAIVPSAVATILVTLVFLFVSLVVTVGIMRAALRTTQGGTPSFADMLTTHRLGKYLLFNLAWVLLMFVGFVLCLIPGLLVAFFLQLGSYYVLDRGYGVDEAVRASFNAIKRNVGPALVMVLFTFLVNILGSTFWGIPTLVTLPFATLFTAHMYRQFNNEPVAV